jgi:hypothetical protein
MSYKVIMQAKHPWKARLIVAFIMLFLGFLGMIMTDVSSAGGWDYWKWIVFVYALLALALSWYIKRQTSVLHPTALWHELLHWIGLIATVYLVSYYAHLGVMSRFVAGLIQLTLLGFGVFLAGIYIETTFLLVGLMLGLFALISAAVSEYLYAFIIPTFLIAVAIVILIVWVSHRKSKSET